MSPTPPAVPTAVPIVAAIGSPAMVRGYALAGVRVLPAEDADEVREAWRSLPADVGLVVLTEQAAQALADTLTAERTWPLVAVMS
jgi:vacuolar-type H+-ATPase subunit F/Vma7